MNWEPCSGALQIIGQLIHGKHASRDRHDKSHQCIFAIDVTATR